MTSRACRWLRNPDVEAQNESEHRKKSMELTAGSRWKSVVSETEIVVVRPAEGDHALGCGGTEMVPVGSDTPPGSVDPALAEPTLLGKRYEDVASGLEVLCSKGGEGILTLDGTPLALKSAKPLPSSD